jgi:uncharacterized protein (TIGR02246 family)
MYMSWPFSLVCVSAGLAMENRFALYKGFVSYFAGIKKTNMKKSIKLSLLSAVISVTAFVTPLKAQDATKELAAFTKKFQAAYNNKDDKTLKTMYTDDATRIGTDGTTSTGCDSIAAQFKDYFTANKVTIVIKQDKVDTQADGSATATGTYHVTGTSNTGEKIDRSGTYTNTVVKVKGHWKISKSVLTAM